MPCHPDGARPLYEHYHVFFPLVERTDPDRATNRFGIGRWDWLAKATNPWLGSLRLACLSGQTLAGLSSSTGSVRFTGAYIPVFFLCGERTDPDRATNRFGIGRWDWLAKATNPWLGSLRLACLSGQTLAGLSSSTGSVRSTGAYITVFFLSYSGQTPTVRQPKHAKKKMRSRSSAVTEHSLMPMMPRFIGLPIASFENLRSFNGFFPLFE